MLEGSDAKLKYSVELKHETFQHINSDIDWKIKYSS